MDIDTEINNCRFVARASAIIYSADRTKVLLFRILGKSYWLLPGGRIKILESSNEAIKREIYEELGYTMDYSLKILEENIIKYKDQNIHQYGFTFVGIYKEKINDEEFLGLEDEYHIYKWVDLKEIKNYNIKPALLKEAIILTDDKVIIHNIYSESN